MFKRWIAVGAVLGMMGTLGVLTMLPSEARYEDVVKLTQEHLADPMRPQTGAIISALGDPTENRSRATIVSLM